VIELAVIALHAVFHKNLPIGRNLPDSFGRNLHSRNIISAKIGASGEFLN
jgi:hypothetical protein